MTVPPNNVRKPVTAANITDATAAGRDMLTAADVAAQRTLLELGTAALSDDADFATAAQGALADSATQPGDLATVATSGSYNDLTDKPTIPAVAKVYEKVALSPNGSAIASGTGKGFIPITTAGTITAVRIDLDAANEPTDQATLVDVNKVDRSTGTATSILTAAMSIATSANSATGTIDGTQSVVAGDWLQIDVDQGSDGQDLICSVEITPS